MPAYFRFGIGPFRFSERLGRTKTQKRAAAKARAGRAQARADRNYKKADARRHAEWEREYYSPEAVAAREDEKRRTYRAVISGCHIDGLKGGEFTVEAEGRTTLHIAVDPDLALRFLSLKKGDIVQVTVGPDGASLEQFWHLSRANGAKPRNPADFGRGELSSSSS
jgi:hypothetical protein